MSISPVSTREPAGAHLGHRALASESARSRSWIITVEHHVDVGARCLIPTAARLDVERLRHARRERAESRVVALDVADLQHDAFSRAGGEQLVGFLEVDRERLFDQHMQAGLEAGAGHFEVASVGNRDHRGLRAGHRLPPVGQRRQPTFVATSSARARSASATPTSSTPARRSELLRVQAPHVAGADDRHLQ